MSLSLTAFSMIALAIVLLAAVPLNAADTDLPDDAVVKWRSGTGEKGQAFDGKTTVVELRAAHEKYDPADGYAVSVWIRPEGFSRMAGIVQHYDSSRTGCWYLSLSTGEPYRKLRVVFIEEGPVYHGIESKMLLATGKWYHVILTFDGHVVSLLCDGRLLGSKRIERPLMVSPKARVEIGRLNKRSYFEGQIRDVRIFDHPIDIATIAVGQNYLRNSSFEKGDHLADMLAWHRMTGIDYLVAENGGWGVVTKGTYHGSKCLQGDGRKPLLLPAEIWASLPRRESWTFSAYMKAERDGVPCELRLGSYRTLGQEYRAERVTLTREWKRHELSISKLHLGQRRSGAVQGPMNFWIKPLKKATVWVDAVQWEPGGKAMAYTASERDRRLKVEEVELLRMPPRPASKPISPNAKQPPGEVPIIMHHAGAKRATQAPVQLGVPFPAEAWNGQGDLTLTDAHGKQIDTQTEVLSQWHGDGSLQSLGVCFETDLDPGMNQLTLRYDPGGSGKVGSVSSSLLTRVSDTRWRVDARDVRIELNPTAGAIWDRIVDRGSGRELLAAASVHAVGLNGTEFDSLHARDIISEVEKEGPLHVSIAKRGVLTSADGEPLLMFVCRLHLWRGMPGVHVELTLVNSRGRDSVALREVYWRTTTGNGTGTVQLPWKSGKAEDEIGLLQYYDYAKKQFCRASVLRGQLSEVRHDERGEVWLGLEAGDRALHLQTRHGWQQHPTMLSAAASGVLKAYVWPARPVMGVEFSRAMSITRDFVLLRTPKGIAHEELAELHGKPPVAMTAPPWFAKADLLLPVYQGDRERFPFLEGRISSPDMLGPLRPEAIESRKTYGLFDYGDNHGDGGWGNLESYSDHAIIMLALRSGDPNMLRQGFISARHYRDMDINQIKGHCITHSPNHVMGGASFSHAWPQGVFSHYLTTGSRRSLEVSLRNGEHMLKAPINYPPLEGGNRTLGRFLLNMADIYQITGDERYLKRFMAQLDHAAELLKKEPDKPDQSYFGRKGLRLVPYHGWYGCIGLIKMYRLSGSESLLPHIRREVQASMNMALYRLDLEQLWPGLPPEQGMPIMCADFARHRGSLFYPVMTAYAKITGERKWADLALRAAYAGAVEGRAASRIQEVLVSAALSACPDDVTEKQLIEEARELVWNAASPKLLNGDFSMSRKYWEHWRPQPGKALGYHDGWQNKRRPLMATLDTEVFKVNAPSFRFNLKSRSRYNRVVVIDSTRVRVAPGRHRMAGWIRSDAGAGALRVLLMVSHLDGRYAPLAFYVRPNETTPKISNSTDLEVKSCQVTPPDAGGWRRLTFEFYATKRCVVTLMFSCYIGKGHEKGHLWLDGLELLK